MWSAVERVSDVHDVVWRGRGGRRMWSVSSTLTRVLALALRPVGRGAEP